MDSNVLKIVYTFFLGIIIALFVGFGIQTFYPAPEPPETPAALMFPEKVNPSETDQQEMLEAQQEQEQAYREFQQESENYSRNVSTVALLVAVGLLGLSLLLTKRSLVMANGIMLGGLFTLLYSFTRGMMSGDTTMTFIAVSVGLAVVLYLGYRRFIQPRNTAPVEGVSAG